MRPALWIVVLVGLSAGVLVAAERPAGISRRPSSLTWDASEKIYHAHAGDTVAVIAFNVRNSGTQSIAVRHVETSCGCTSAILPSYPWVIAPNASGSMTVRIDLIGKSGALHKTATVYTSAGVDILNITVTLPPMDDAARSANQALAHHNRQAVFQGECAKCHAAPTKGEDGFELFQSACAICHLSEHRASFVPDLSHVKGRRDAAFWRNVIHDGRPGTLMPAFSEAEGGPLTSDQIDALANLLLTLFPDKTADTKIKPTKPSAALPHITDVAHR